MTAGGGTTTARSSRTSARRRTRGPLPAVSYAQRLLAHPHALGEVGPSREEARGEHHEGEDVPCRGEAGREHHGRGERRREGERRGQAGVRRERLAAHLFSSAGSPVRGPLLLLRLSRRRRFRRRSGPVRKSVSRRWTKKSMPASGQMESLVVAEVRVPRTGARRPRRRGGRRSGRMAEVAGRSAASEHSKEEGR